MLGESIYPVDMVAGGWGRRNNPMHNGLVVGECGVFGWFNAPPKEKKGRPRARSLEKKDVSLFFYFFISLSTSYFTYSRVE